jgi:hypothetical protein
MTNKEYIELFHRAQVNLVAFKPVFHCDDELRRMVEVAIEDEREACAKLCENFYRNGNWITKEEAAAAIRARGEK